MAGTIHEIDDKSILNSLKEDARAAVLELIEAACLKAGDILVVGCSTSETLGENIGSWSVPDAGCAIYEGIASVTSERGIFVCAQCCEHLNRALIIEKAAIGSGEYVNVVPKPKAGGSFATAAYNLMENPVAIEHVKADAGIDIGGTLIGMHLKEVAVPVKLVQNRIGKAPVTAARVRPKYIGGERAAYDSELSAGYKK